MKITKFQEALEARMPGLKEHHEKNRPKRELSLLLRASRKALGMACQEIMQIGGLSEQEIELLEAPSGDMPTEEQIAKYARHAKENPHLIDLQTSTSGRDLTLRESFARQ
ncbi:hypothetical protein DL239_15220 [Sedimentitalea sp. CY04]|uniref:Uncharacterized protein n=1 Tax=Parasedimentitalea denitrificans TaxID=2211118 RepID=A0ABX0WDH1_9RHOB|nr:hypothetical protein [Sedimentitalea sp. CY04]NIZ62325.1 hypothetical protein [Sedimentitalea sp. CY04]